MLIKPEPPKEFVSTRNPRNAGLSFGLPDAWGVIRFLHLRLLPLELSTQIPAIESPPDTRELTDKRLLMAKTRSTRRLEREHGRKRLVWGIKPAGQAVFLFFPPHKHRLLRRFCNSPFAGWVPCFCNWVQNWKEGTSPPCVLCQQVARLSGNSKQNQLPWFGLEVSGGGFPFGPFTGASN